MTSKGKLTGIKTDSEHYLPELPEVVMADYAQRLDAALPDEGQLTLEDCWNSVKAAINNAAEGAIGFVERN